MIDLNKKFNINIIFILFLWITIFLFILFFNRYTNKQLESDTSISIESIARESSLNINSNIENKFTILETVAHNISIEDLSNPKKLASSFDDIVTENHLKRMAIATPDGTAYFDNGDIINISDCDYFKASIDGNRFVSSISISKLNGKKINVFSIPIYKDTKVIAVLLLSISTEEFYNEIDLNTISKLGENYIINSEGNIIAYDGKATLDPDNFNLFDEIKDNENNDNNESLEIIKKDFKNLDNGYVKLNLDKKDKCYLYYTKLDNDDWWLLTLIHNKTLKNYYAGTTITLTIFNILITLLISIIFIILLINKIKDYRDLKSIVYTDTITEGNNDIFLKNNISKRINKKENFAFISLEIINIKNIVTIAGLKYSELLLKETYEYLYNILNKDEIVVHSYFGEYKLILKYSDIKELTKRLENINFSTIDSNIKFRIGIYLIDNYDVSYEEMCLYVSIAKESLDKNITSNKYAIYTKEMYKTEIDKIRLEEDIKNGIENKEFKAAFQPKYGKDGKSIIGAEALVRWYKYGSIISPDIFVPMCEANGLIKEIDELVFEDVCKNIRNWIDNNKNVVPICVNLSRSYLDKTDLIDNIERYIDKYKISRDLIQFEITESSLMGNEDILKDIVSLLHEKGFEVLVDDFGVGYSSIKAISYVNFDALKIDKSFVDGIGEQKWESIIEYTVKLANNLGMIVVAEGIETEEQYKFLLKCNCDMFQGYYFSKPLDSNDFSKLI